MGAAFYAFMAALAAYGASEQHEAKKSQETAAEAARRRTEVQNRQKIVENQRQMRRAIAQQNLLGVSQGVSFGSSPFAGARTSIGTQAGAAQGFMGGMNMFNQQEYNAVQNAATAQSNAAIAGTIGSVASSAYNRG